MNVYAYQQHSAEIWALLLEHIGHTVTDVIVSVLIGIPLGILISYRRRLQTPVLQAANTMQAIPSLALLGFADPLFQDRPPAGDRRGDPVASLLPIIKNTFTGIARIPPATREAARVSACPVGRFCTRSSCRWPAGHHGRNSNQFRHGGRPDDDCGLHRRRRSRRSCQLCRIRTVDTAQILSGAIPACLLALAVDYLLRAGREQLIHAGRIPGKRPLTRTTCCVSGSEPKGIVAVIFRRSARSAAG